MPAQETKIPRAMRRGQKVKVKSGVQDAASKGLPDLPRVRRSFRGLRSGTAPLRVTRASNVFLEPVCREGCTWAWFLGRLTLSVDPGMGTDVPQASTARQAHRVRAVSPGALGKMTQQKPPRLCSLGAFPVSMGTRVCVGTATRAEERCAEADGEAGRGDADAVSQKGSVKA